MRDVQKYLSNYAESETKEVTALFRALPAHQQYNFQYCLCMPVYNENPALLSQFIRTGHAQALTIIVVNQPNDYSEPSEQNKAFVQKLQQQLLLLTAHKNLALYQTTVGSAILLVDRYTPTRMLEPSQAVGLARKIAADIALQLINDNIVRCPLIYCSDADVVLPTDYFESAEKTFNEQTAALLYPFKHLAKSCIHAPNDRRRAFSGKETSQPAADKIHLATTIYEKKLFQYISGLKLAGSAYAYHSLGSTLCISAKNYAYVRGFPKKSAGEDFYVLNKLRKTGDIISLSSPEIAIESRESTRTPFGTGHAVKRLLDSANPAQEKIFYHPHLFHYLSYTLRWFRTLSSRKNIMNVWRNDFSRYLNTHSTGINSRLPDPSAKTSLLIETLEQLYIERCLQHCYSQSRNEAQFERQFQHWFDAFKTLKWIHCFRSLNSDLENISYDQLLYLQAADPTERQNH